jgi:hypothetical protein
LAVVLIGRVVFLWVELKKWYAVTALDFIYMHVYIYVNIPVCFEVLQERKFRINKIAHQIKPYVYHCSIPRMNYNYVVYCKEKYICITDSIFCKQVVTNRGFD